MKVLVATSRTQGARPGDFHWGIDGELVWISEPCATDRRRLGRSCGCGRSFAGLASHRAMTTAEVREIPELTMADYVRALAEGLADAGWPSDWAPEMARDQARLADGWDEGAVIERDLDLFTERLIGGHPQISPTNRT
jgi:hypothetical protein